MWKLKTIRYIWEIESFSILQMHIRIDLYRLDIRFLLGILGLDTRTLSRIGYVSLNLCNSEQSISWEVFHFALRCGCFFWFVDFPSKIMLQLDLMMIRMIEWLAHFERSDAIRKKISLKLGPFVHQWCLLVVKVTPYDRISIISYAFKA